MSWDSRAQFFGFDAEVMRRLLTDHARARLSAKRNAGEPTIALDRGPDLKQEEALHLDDLISLDLALQALEAYDVELSRLVAMKYFGGLDLEQLASLLGVSRADRTTSSYTLSLVTPLG